MEKVDVELSWFLVTVFQTSFAFTVLSDLTEKITRPELSHPELFMAMNARCTVTIQIQHHYSLELTNIYLEPICISWKHAPSNLCHNFTCNERYSVHHNGELNFEHRMAFPELTLHQYKYELMFLNNNVIFLICSVVDISMELPDYGNRSASREFKLQLKIACCCNVRMFATCHEASI